MNFNVITRNINRKILVVKKQSPHIFFVGGVIGTVASTVLACRATLKLSEKLDHIQKEIIGIKENNPELSNETAEVVWDYPLNQYQKDLYYIYAKGSLDIVKLYAPAVVVGVVSIGALTGSHVQLSRRNAALMAAYSVVQNAYEEYRNRVRDQLGEEKELALYHGEVAEKEEKGKKRKSIDPNKMSPYARFFDEYSPRWEKDPELNRLYVQCQQNYANNLLQARGHLFLNEVYDMLEIERSKAGAVVGWVIRKDGEGDNYVDFGIFEAFNSTFVNGSERSILLDFNVDGVIYDKI